MLPRVSDALSKFVKPIAATNAESRVRENGFERHRVLDATGHRRKRKEREGKGSQPPLRVISEGKSPEAPMDGSAKQAEPPKTGEAALPMPEGFAPPGTPSVAHTFMNLLNQFKKTRASLVRWFGSQTYRSSSRRAGRQSGKFKKGTMLDENVE